MYLNGFIINEHLRKHGIQKSRIWEQIPGIHFSVKKGAISAIVILEGQNIQ